MQIHRSCVLRNCRHIGILALAVTFLVGLSLTGCGRSAGPATAVLRATPYPTYTVYPTFTPLPTYTAYPTLMPAAVEVMVITQTPNPTYTVYPTYTPYPQVVIQPPTEPPPAAPAGPTVYSWQDAGQHIGEDALVEGTIVRTHNAGSVIFLNFTENYQGTFTVVIFPDDAGKFPQPPEQLFLNQSVRVQGLIAEFRGTPQIVVNEPAQIEIMNR